MILGGCKFLWSFSRNFWFAYKRNYKENVKNWKKLHTFLQSCMIKKMN